MELLLKKSEVSSVPYGTQNTEREELQSGRPSLRRFNAKIYTCRKYEANQNVFVRRSRDRPLKTILIPWLYSYWWYTPNDAQIDLQRYRCQGHCWSISPAVISLQLQWKVIMVYLKKVEEINKSKFIQKLSDDFINLMTHIFIYIFSQKNTSLYVISFARNYLLKIELSLHSAVITSIHAVALLG